MAADKKEEVKPLAPATHRITIKESDKAAAISVEFMTTRRHQKCIKCCGCSTAILLIISTIILVLMFTVFHVRNPVLKMNAVNIEGLEIFIGIVNFHPGLNLTLEADVSVKNPNVASFKFSNTTTEIYYDGSVIGEARTPSGRAKARRTYRTNVSIELMVDRIVGVGRFRSDLAAGILTFSSSTRVSGKVKINDMIKKSIAVRMNCTMSVNISSQAIEDQNCGRRVSL